MQPALSAGLSGLERELGITIIMRNRSFEGITPEGERVLPGPVRCWRHWTDCVKQHQTVPNDDIPTPEQLHKPLWERATLLSDIGGLRSALAKSGITIKASSTEEVLSNPVGGLLIATFDHPGPAIVNVLTTHYEIPPMSAIEPAQAAGFALYGLRSLLVGKGKEVIDTASEYLQKR